MEKQINIIIASDERYLCHATVTMLSILHNSKSKNICFYFLDEGIGCENRDYLKKEINKLNGRIEFINLNKKMFEKFPVNGHIRQSTYYRIIAPYLLPTHIKKAIYLDSDLIVKADIAELFNIDIENQIIGAVEESPQNIQKLIDLGIENGCYFNAGVMLIDLLKWKEARTTEKVIKFIEENPDKLMYWDQDALNATFCGRWFNLDYKWNVQTKYFEFDKYKQACENPAIIHYTTDIKPWHIYSQHPYKQLYLEYRSKTCWGKKSLINNKLLERVNKGSKLILFGTGKHAERITKSLPYEVAYFLDNDERKNGTFFLQKLVEGPMKLLNEDKGRISIVIASMHIKEIEEQLTGIGFKKNVHYFELHES